MHLFWKWSITNFNCLMRIGDYEVTAKTTMYTNKIMHNIMWSHRCIKKSHVCIMWLLHLNYFPQDRNNFPKTFKIENAPHKIPKHKIIRKTVKLEFFGPIKSAKYTIFWQSQFSLWWVDEFSYNLFETKTKTQNWFAMSTLDIFYFQVE